MLCNYSFVTSILGKALHIPSFSETRSPWTVWPFGVIPEQGKCVKIFLFVLMSSTKWKWWFLSSTKIFYYSWAAQNFIICFFHCPKLADSGLQKLNSRAAWNVWFSEGVVCFLSFLCRSSPGFDPKMDIPEQHKIKTSFMSSTKLNTWKHFDNNKNLCSIAAQNPKTY